MPTTLSAPSGYGVLMKRWLFEKAEREPKKSLGPLPADAAALCATWLGS